MLESAVCDSPLELTLERQILEIDCVHTSEVCLPRFLIEMLNLMFCINLLLWYSVSFGFGSGDVADVKRILFIWWQKCVDIDILH